MTVSIDDVKKIDAFRHLDEALLGCIAEKCRPMHKERDEEIVAQQARTTDVFFVAEGSVRAAGDTAIGRPITFQILEAGGMFGELAALDCEPRNNKVVAVTDCELLRMQRNDFLECMCNADFATAIARRLVALSRWLGSRVYQFSAYGVRGRVYAEILRIAKDAQGAEGNDGVVVEKAPSDNDIGSRVVATRENVNRMIGTLRKLGVVQRERSGAITVHSITRLEQLLQEEELRDNCS